MSVTLWVPTGNARPESWLQVEGYMRQTYPEKINFVVTRRSRYIFDEWNRIVKEFLEGKDEWLWSVHDDVVVHPQTLERLLSWEKPLVGALIFHRSHPALPHIWIDGDAEEYMQCEDTKRWFLKHQDAIIPGPVVMNPRPDDALIEAIIRSAKERYGLVPSGVAPGGKVREVA